MFNQFFSKPSLACALGFSSFFSVLSLPSQAAWLVDHFPDEAVAYARLPSITSVLTQEKGTMLAPLQANNSYQMQVNMLFGKMLSSPLFAELEAENKEVTLVKDFFIRWINDAEIGFFATDNEQNPLGVDAILTATFNGEEAQLFALFEALATHDDIEFIKTDGQPPKLLLQGLAFTVLFENSRLLMTNKAMTSLDAFKVAIDDVEQTAQRPTHKSFLEAQDKVDPSGKGFMIYADYPKTVALMSASKALPPEMMVMTNMMGQIDYITAGWGFDQGNAQISAYVKSPYFMARQFIPKGSKVANIGISGDLNWQFSVNMPDYPLLQMWLSLAMQTKPELQPEIRAFETAFAESGVTLMEFVNASAGKTYFFSDDAGTFAALELEDQPKFMAMIDKLTESQWLVSDEANGIYRSKLDIASVLAQLQSKDDAVKMSEEDKHSIQWANIMYGGDSYWQLEGNTLLVASYPQALMDRHVTSTLSDWMDSQHLENQATIINAAFNLKDFNRTLFNYNLDMVAFMARVADYDLDFRKLPSFNQLKMNGTGASNLDIVADEQFIGVKLGFENTPYDVVLHSLGSSSVMYMGILAAVAMPAYQDYVARANEMSALGGYDEYNEDPTMMVPSTLLDDAHFVYWTFELNDYADNELIYEGDEGTYFLSNGYLVAQTYQTEYQLAFSLENIETCINISMPVEEAPDVCAPADL